MNIFTNKFFIEFDEARDVLRITNPTQRIANEQLQIAEIRLSTLENMWFEKSAEFVGERILLLIPKLREVLWESSEAGQKVKTATGDRESSLSEAANTGNASAQYDLAIYFIEKGIKNSSWKDIELAEDWVTRAAKNGNHEAEDFLIKDWPALKESLKIRFS